MKNYPRHQCALGEPKRKKTLPRSERLIIRTSLRYPTGNWPLCVGWDDLHWKWNGGNSLPSDSIPRYFTG